MFYANKENIDIVQSFLFNSEAYKVMVLDGKMPILYSGIKTGSLATYVLSFRERFMIHFCCVCALPKIRHRPQTDTRQFLAKMRVSQLLLCDKTLAGLFFLISA